MPVKVLVVDDSALVRRLLSELIRQNPEFEVVGTAADPYEARDKIKALNPDVLTLDVEMPKMDGLTFLRHLMRLRPMPVVMVSSLTERGADVTIEALETGAVDFITKPASGVADGLTKLADALYAKLEAAAQAKVFARERPPAPAIGVRKQPLLKTTDRMIAIGASTGGTEAIAHVLSQFPADAPAVVITQHIPELFSARFAQRLDDQCAMAVSEAKDGDPILLGHAYVAPGSYHLRVERSGARYFCRVTQDPPVNRHRPSVDVLFESVAKEVGHNATGVILTGMGDDGANGLLAMRQAGSPTVAQDKSTCVVFGMPGEAVKRGAAEEVLPLEAIAQRVLEVSRR
ncbi:MAG TPA: chemotaxis response regulator protein-glutamate methylesterase [Polyangiaceae bacterium]|nr:chemotaxis response regulator protein-glutamate methylesterase [Polyangiaceae bacterium]